MGDVLCGGEGSAESISAVLRCKGDALHTRRQALSLSESKGLGFRKMKITILI